MTTVGVDSRAGLTAGEARRRLAEYGPGRFPQLAHSCRVVGPDATTAAGPRRRLQGPRAERMTVTPPSSPSAQSVQTVSVDERVFASSPSTIERRST